MEKKFYTTQEVAEILNVGVQQIRNWYNTGRITGTKLAGKHSQLRFTESDLDYFDKKGREF